MKKKIIAFIFILVGILFFTMEDVHAFTPEVYRNRNLCGTFEVAIFHSDGTISQNSCHATLALARTAMRNHGSEGAVVLTRINNVVRVVDANFGLIDFTVNPDQLALFFNNANLSGTRETFMNHAPQYGGTTGAFISSHVTPAGLYTFEVKIAGFRGWVSSRHGEIVPLTWARSPSNYTVTNDHIRHNYSNRVSGATLGTRGSTIGPRPSMLQPGTYFSFDGHFFYTNLRTLLTDYRNRNFNNAVNAGNPYYNYYMFLPNRTRSTYSSFNIDQFIRDGMGITRDAFGNRSNDAQSSRLFGTGTAFFYSQQRSGVNALLSLSLSRNETGNGRSNLAVTRNNGFGLNAVDSNPTQAANWFPTFTSSIMEYASRWVNDGYNHPSDWRFRGSQFGHKGIGMAVFYASDPFWSEKMAAHAFAFDRHFGMQDYNFYQLGVTTRQQLVMSAPTSWSRTIYSIPTAEHAVVIVGEVQGEAVDGNTTWYRIMSDLNIDANGNALPRGANYNWEGYVYVPAARIRRINQGRNGAISPNDVTQFINHDFTYDWYTSNGQINPRVAVATRDTHYYTDASFANRRPEMLREGRHVMVYATAYNRWGTPVAYLVTRDYQFDQKEWVAADSIRFTTARFGRISITVPNANAWAWVNSGAASTQDTVISGLYTNTFFPILETRTIGNQTFHRVPVNLTGNGNVYGWTLHSATNVQVTTFQYTSTNTPPVINAGNRTITQGREFNALEGVSAIDQHNRNITSRIVVSGNFDINTPGVYTITLTVTCDANQTVSRTITLTVVADTPPVITAPDINTRLGSEFDPMTGVTAFDEEDGDITENIIVVENNVDIHTLGTYTVTYSVTDSFGHTVTKTRNVTVVEVELVEREGLFHFEHFREIGGRVELQGFNTISGMNNVRNTNITHQIEFYNIDTHETILVDATRMLDSNNFPRPVPSFDGFDYTYSWFRFNINLSDVGVGTFRMSIISTSDEFFSRNIISNRLFREQVTQINQDYHALVHHNFNLRTGPVELIIREEQLAPRTTNHLFNQFDTFRAFEFTDNNLLRLMGLTFSYGMDLSPNMNVTRHIIFENQETFTTHRFELGSITNGLHSAVLPVPDGLDKTRAWYDASIDISNLPVGDYVIYIATQSNISDVFEFTERLNRSLDHVNTTMNGKHFQFRVNHNRGSRIELTVREA